MRKFALQPTREAQPTRRRGFTIIELMVAVVIIAALAALLLPALQRSRRSVRITEVRNEISQLESAIADFKAVFNTTPPSSITLYEQASGWAGDPKSRAIIKGIWPRFDFSMNRSMNDDNFDGIINSTDDTNDTFVLEGDQCLVFFLGGMYLPPPGMNPPASDPGELIGFSSNPKNPFDPTKSGTRVGPFFGFNPGRVKRTIAGASYTANTKDFPVYFDPLDGQTNPYVYASSYEGQGYNDSSTDSDVNTGAHSEPGNFRIYRTDIRQMSATTDPAAWNPKGFQIISPGFDGKYGLGGPFKPDADIKLPEFGANVVDTDRYVERDNITNFHSGELDP